MRHRAGREDRRRRQLRPSGGPEGGYTLLGSPTVIAAIDSPAATSQLAARLVDVAPGGEATLVARGLYRPGVSVRGDREVFQLHGNAWKFEEGHRPKLELLPTDSPYGRASNGQGEISVSDLELRLPVHDRPGTGGVVTQRLKPFVPQGRELARDFRRLERPNARVGSRKLKAKGRKLRIKLVCPGEFERCTGVTKLRAAKGGAKVAKRSFALTAAKPSKTLRAKLTKRAHRTLRNRGRLKVVALTDTVEGIEPVQQRVKIVAARGR